MSLWLETTSLFAQGPLIYGYLSAFPAQSNSVSQDTVAWLSKYHVKYVQFYDWQWKHHVPLAGTVASPAVNWTDIAGRTNSRQTVLDLIAACHAYGMKAMNYNLLDGANAGYGSDGSGVNFQWGLWNSTNGCGSGSQWAFSVFGTSLYMFNPANTNWQNYLFSRENDMFAAYPFDGWHMDQLGDPGSLKYDCAGAPVDVWQTFAPFLNKARAATGKRIIFNNVSTYGMFSSINQTTNDAVYVECWPGSQTTYNDLKQVIDNGLAWGNGKPVILAAYMNYNQPSGSFRTSSVLLTDVAIFASGGTHLELGDGGHMLCNEYFPNHRLTLDSSLADSLTNYYHFIVTYQGWLYGGMSNSANLISLSIPATNQAAPQQVWAFAKIKNGNHLLNLINLIGQSNINWRDDNGDYPPPTIQTNFTVKYYHDNGPVACVQIASPDVNGGIAAGLSFTNGSDAGGNFVELTVPRLDYWDVVMISGNTPALEFNSAHIQGEDFVFTWTGPPNSWKILEHSTNLTGPWVAIQTNEPPTSATNSFVSPITSQLSSYFRLTAYP